jgi:hypothetical protein
MRRSGLDRSCEGRVQVGEASPLVEEPARGGAKTAQSEAELPSTSLRIQIGHSVHGAILRCRCGSERDGRAQRIRVSVEYYRIFSAPAQWLKRIRSA